MPRLRIQDTEWARAAAVKSVDRPVAPSYFLILTAVSFAATFIVDRDLLPTMAVLLGLWLVVTLILRPGYHLAGAGAVVALTITLAVRNYSDLDTAGRAWGLLVLALLALPYVLQPLRNSSGFPFLHFYCLIVGIYIYVTVLFARPSKNYAVIYPNEIRTAGLRTMALFVAVLVAVGMATSVLFRMRTTKPKRLPAIILDRRTILRAYMLMVGGLALLFITFFGGVYQSLGSIAGALRLITFGGWLVLVYAWMDGGLAIRHRIVVLIAPIGWILATLGDSALYQASYPGFFVLALWLARRRSIPWLPILAALVVLITMNSGKGEFREDLRTGQVQGSTTALGVTWVQQTQSSLGDTTEEQLKASAWRFSNSDVLGYVATWVPDRYPYFGYSAYTTLPLVLVPRVLMPDKPAINFENQFGRDYELIARSDFATTVNTPLAVEAFAAGGWAMMFVVAIGIGVYFGLLNRIFASRSPAALITASLLALQVVLAAETGMLSMILILPFALFLYPLIWWATTGAGRDGPARTEADRPAPHQALPIGTPRSRRRALPETDAGTPEPVHRTGPAPGPSELGLSPG